MPEETIMLAIGDGSEPPTEFRIFAAGKTATSKGMYLFDEQAGASVLAAFKEHGADALPLDYGHHMLMGGHPDGQRAAGWFKPEVRQGELWASDVQWTPKAAAAIRDREYRFISPALQLDQKTRRVTRLMNVALTNLPATKNLRALVASDTVPSKENHMSENETGVALLSALSADSLSAALGTITALREEAGKVKVLSEELATIKLEVATRDVDKLLSEAKDTGKVSEAELPALREQGIKDVKWLSGYLAIKTPSPVATPEVKAPKGSGEVLALSESDKEMCRLFGVKPAGLLKTRGLILADDVNNFEEMAVQ